MVHSTYFSLGRKAFLQGMKKLCSLDSPWSVDICGPYGWVGPEDVSHLTFLTDMGHTAWVVQRL